MTTDTIPEAQKLAEQIRHSDSLCNNEDEMASLISKACIFYHKRKSQELQKQCEALETALNDWHKLADQRSEALVKAQQQCEELLARESYKAKLLEYDALELAELRTRAEKAEAEVAEWKAMGPLEIEARRKLFALQQDVRPLLHDVRIALIQSRGVLDEDTLVPPHCVTACLGMVDAFIAKHPELK